MFIRRNFWQSLKNSVGGVQNHLKFSEIYTMIVASSDKEWLQ